MYVTDRGVLCARGEKKSRLLNRGVVMGVILLLNSGCSKSGVDDDDADADDDATGAACAVDDDAKGGGFSVP